MFHCLCHQSKKWYRQLQMSEMWRCFKTETYFITCVLTQTVIYFKSNIFNKCTTLKLSLDIYLLQAQHRHYCVKLPIIIFDKCLCANLFMTNLNQGWTNMLVFGSDRDWLDISLFGSDRSLDDHFRSSNSRPESGPNFRKNHHRVPSHLSSCLCRLTLEWTNTPYYYISKPKWRLSPILERFPSSFHQTVNTALLLSSSSGKSKSQAKLSLR